MRLFAAALALLSLFPRAASAQGKGGSPAPFEFRALGDDGSMVTDLKPSDLSLKVNGKPRAIQSLSIFQANADAIAGSSPLPPPYATNVAGQGGRIIHVLVDDDSISPGQETQVKDAIGILSAELTPRDRIGILNTQGTINIPPTTDVARVRTAASGFTGKAGHSETDQESRCRTRRVIAALGTMISLSGAAPTTIVTFSSGLATPAVKNVAVGSRGDAGRSELCPVEPADFTNLAEIASTANVDLYLFQAVDASVAGGSGLDAGYESLAGVTGAEYMKLPASPQSALSRLLRETSSYYVATFEPEPGERNGLAQRVELKTAREKVRLRVRPAVMITKPAAPKSLAPKDMLRVAAAYRELPLRSTAYASRMPGNNDMRVVALFEPVDTSAAIAAASVGLFDGKGTLKAQWTAQKSDLARRPARADLQVPPGTYRMRVAVVDESGRGGTTDEDVRAEPARADPLTLSALVIGTQSAGGGFSPRLEFGTEAVAIGLLEIYDVPKTGAIAVTLDVVSTPDGQPLATAETTLRRGSAEDARTAIGGFGIDNLPSGDYLMRAVVSLDGRPVGKAVKTLRKTR